MASEPLTELQKVNKAMSRMKPENRDIVDAYISGLVDALKCSDSKIDSAYRQRESDRSSLLAHAKRIDYLMRRASLFEALFGGAIHHALMGSSKEKAEAYAEYCWKKIDELAESYWAKNNP